jgi:hypothetical protein
MHPFSAECGEVIRELIQKAFLVNTRIKSLSRKRNIFREKHG